MNYIGEFQKDSTILLELLTKDEENQSIATDFPPTATIEHYDQNGLQQVDNVTLETMEDGSSHTKLYHIPLDWKHGEYIITYRAVIGGVEYTTQESFMVLEEPVIVEPDIDPTEEEDVEEPVTNADGYIMPSDFQTASTIEVLNNQIVITLQDDMKYNHTYQVVLDQEIKSTSGNKLNATKTITFSSEYKPVLATPLEVRSILRSAYRYFTIHEVYTAIRDAGQKAFQMLGRVVDANSTRYREYTDRETTYFQTTKYVLYEAARSLLTGLIVRILDGGSGDEDDPGLGGSLTGSGGSVTLDDFSVSDGSSSSGSGGTSADNEESQLEKLNALIAQIEKELKFWQDSMMGHNRRGYARPVSSSFRTAAGSPEGRDFE